MKYLRFAKYVFLCVSNLNWDQILILPNVKVARTSVNASICTLNIGMPLYILDSLAIREAELEMQLLVGCL